MKKILCPIDFSESSITAAHWAGEIAQRKNWGLVLFHKYAVSMLKDETLSSNKDLMEKAYAKAEMQLIELKEKINKPHIPCEIYLEYGIELEDMILQIAKDAKVSLIVMGTEGAESISDVIFGSNTSNVVNLAHIPVLVIPAASKKEIPETIIYATDLQHESKYIMEELFHLSSGLFKKIIFLHGNENPDLTPSDSLLEKFKPHLPDNAAFQSAVKIEFAQINCQNLFNGIQDFAANQQDSLIAVGKHPRSFLEFITKGSMTRLMSLYSFIPTLVLYKEK